MLSRISVAGPRAHARPRGFTLMEIAVTLTVVSVVLAIAVPKLRSITDRSAARAAALDVATALGNARRLAITRHTPVAVRFDTTGRRMVVHAGADTLRVRELGARYGVRVAPSRDSVAFDPWGLGFGAANASILLTRGAAAETVVVARLGRIRR